jgi:hypothetical protein
MNDFEYLITSSPDREKLSCEIYYQGEIIAEISQETPDVLLEIYPPKNKDWWTIPLKSFQKAVAYASDHLDGKI